MFLNFCLRSIFMNGRRYNGSQYSSKEFKNFTESYDIEFAIIHKQTGPLNTWYRRTFWKSVTKKKEIPT